MLSPWRCATLLTCFYTATSVLHSESIVITSSHRHALILGCNGFLGSRLHAALRSRPYTTISCVRDRQHVDLRNASAFYEFLATVPPVHVIFFLAAEVGGSKFLTTAQRAIVDSNSALYNTVFTFAAQHPGVQVLFTSSYMRFSAGEVGPHNAYSAIKAVGEQWAVTLPNARIIRLWNVYGFEVPSHKSHVLGDWSHALAAGVSSIACGSSGVEERQWMHVSDAAEAIAAVAEHWEQVEVVTDVASGVWLSLRRVGEVLCGAHGDIQREAGLTRTCEILYGNDVSPPRARIGPSRNSSFHAQWRAWMQPASAAYDEVRLCVQQGAQPVADDEQGREQVGWVPLPCGLHALMMAQAAQQAPRAA